MELILLGQIPLLLSDWDEFKIHKQSIIDFCLLKEKSNTIESMISVNAKHNMWESEFNFLDLDDSLIPLKLWIIKTASQMISDINRINHNAVITESWVHVTKNGGYHKPHYHNNSTWSGIFYIHAEDTQSGNNNLYLPYYIERKPGLEFADDRHTVNFKQGRMILFPSMMMHDAEPYHGKESRIVIGFNLICL